MTTVAEITDPLLPTYLPVPPAADGICTICHRAPAPGYRSCQSCDLTASQVNRPVQLVTPISMYVVGGQLWLALRRYKDSPYPAIRARFRLEVAALFGRFIKAHAECIAAEAGGDWTAVVPVPSGHGRQGPHPFSDALQVLRNFPWPIRDILQPTGTPLEHRAARDDAFAVTEDVAGAAMLLVDDTWTTGASVQSAASALQLAGATVRAAVPVGRVLDLDYGEANAELHARLSKTPFSFDVCCLESLQ